jgi:uncharacterized protein YciI
MTKQKLFGVVFSLFLVAAVCVNAQETKAEPESKMVQFQMALLKRGPKWTAAESPETRQMLTQHIAYVQSLIEGGKAVLAGPIGGEGDLRGIYVLRAKDAAEAQAWIEADPAIKSGHFISELHPWWSEEVMKPPQMPLKLTTVYLAFLTRGAKWTAERTPQTEEIQKAHMANIGRLAQTKKLVAAGPFGDNGTLRGIFVFKVASLAEAKALGDTDPAVQAGRLALEVYPWMIPEGMLP